MDTDNFFEGLAQELRNSIDSIALTSSPCSYADETCLTVPAPSVKSVSQILKKRFPFLMDVCGVDYPGRERRFDVVYHFANPATRRRLRLKASISEDEAVPSICGVYRSANWFEREAFDMFGIRFEGHPDLRRILCHADFVGHPLRKDYPADKQQPCTTIVDHTFANEYDPSRKDEPGEADRTWINIGPAHPATHGILRLMAVLSGETIEKLDLEIGYLHRCFEKMCETHCYNQIIPYTDRLNYCSAPLNNNAWCRTIEKMLNVRVPPRAQAIRVILDEFSRIMDHFVCIGALAVDVGALSNFWFGFQARERIYTLLEALCGSRLTVSLARVGGLGFDLPLGWIDKAKETLSAVLQAHAEINHLLTKNRIFTQRTVGAGPISATDAIDFGFTGPCLRASGVGYDIRQYAPYDGYDQLSFDIPIGSRGDTYDRYMVRMEEIIQSTKIIDQVLRNVPDGPIAIDDPKIVLPKKEDVYENIEGLMNHFMLIIDGVQPPPGEIYGISEAANGELGFYVVSDGSGKPYRVKCRPPCFAILQAFPTMVQGQMIPDAIAVLSSLNYIAGELDR